MVAIYLIKTYGWPAVFTFGGIVSTVMIPLVLIALPESLDFLLLKRPRNALARINLLLKRIGREPIAALPEVTETKAAAREAASARRLFDKTFTARTLTITTAYFFVVMSFYFMLNWTPKVLVDQGLDISTGISGAVLINVGGVFGGLLLGWFTHKFGLIRLASLYMFLVFCGMTAFGFVESNLPLLAVLAVFTGFFMIGSIVSLYAITGAAYPVQVRNTGTGFVIGAGRAGGILGPYLGGLLIAAGWTKPEYTLALAVPSAIAALVILMVSLNDTAPSAARAPARA
jgi:MFS family permease